MNKEQEYRTYEFEYLSEVKLRIAATQTVLCLLLI